MPEITKEDKKTPEDCEELPEKSSPSEDQTARSYYYDDACGYEVYTDEEDDEAENQTTSAPAETKLDEN